MGTGGGGGGGGVILKLDFLINCVMIHLVFALGFITQSMFQMCQSIESIIQIDR